MKHEELYIETLTRSSNMKTINSKSQIIPICLVVHFMCILMLSTS